MNRSCILGDPAIIDAKFALEVKGLSIVHVARLFNIPGLVYSIYQHETSFPSAGLNCKQREVSSIGLWLFWYFLLVFLLKFLYRNERILEEQARHDISLALVNLRVL